MAAHERGQWVGKGTEQTWWIFTYKNIAGMVLGGVVGTRIGQAMGGHVWEGVMGAVGVAAGLLMTRKGGSMPAQELEQFLGKGEEKAWWIFTYKNVAGVVVGGFMGNRIGQLMGGGIWNMLMIVVGAALGLLVTLNQRGLMWGRRRWIALWFYLSEAVSPTTIDAATLYTVTTEEEQRLVFTHDGATIKTGGAGKGGAG